jgi:hypothetical protein
MPHKWTGLRVAGVDEAVLRVESICQALTDLMYHSTFGHFGIAWATTVDENDRSAATSVLAGINTLIGGRTSRHGS